MCSPSESVSLFLLAGFFACLLACWLCCSPPQWPHSCCSKRRRRRRSSAKLLLVLLLLRHYVHSLVGLLRRRGMRGKEEHYYHHHHLAWSFCWVASSRELSSLTSGMYFFHVPICCCCSCRDCRHSVASAGSVVERASFCLLFGKERKEVGVNGDGETRDLTQTGIGKERRGRTTTLLVW